MIKDGLTHYAMFTVASLLMSCVGVADLWIVVLLMYAGSTKEDFDLTNDPLEHMKDRTFNLAGILSGVFVGNFFEL
jgi:hypothetical protein